MKWDQIESKWALMTRRIRGDWGEERTDATEASVRRDALKAAIAGSQTSAIKDSEFKTLVK